MAYSYFGPSSLFPFYSACISALFSYGITVCAPCWRNLMNMMAQFEESASTISSLSLYLVVMITKSKCDHFFLLSVKVVGN